MIRRAAVRLSMSGAVVALASMAAGCGKLEQKGQEEPAKLRADAKRQKAACGSSAGYDRLKGLMFDQAIETRTGDRAALDTLADYSIARMEDPVVEGSDAALDITRCKGRFILDVPPGAERAFAGQRSLQADIAYTAQAAADGNGFVYKVSGAEPIVTRLAAFNLTAAAVRPPPAIDEAPGDAVAPEPTAVAQAEVPEPAPRAAAKPTAPRLAEARPSPPAERAVARLELPELEREERAPVRVADNGGEAAVRAFYGALGAGNGRAASAQVIPEKRAGGPYSPEAISRFYGRLPEPVRLTGLVPLSGNTYRVSYRYAAGRSRCNGSAVVRVTQRDGRDLIRSIRALNGC